MAKRKPREKAVPAPPLPPPVVESHPATPFHQGFPFLKTGPEMGQELGGYRLRHALPPGEYGFSFRAETAAGGKPVILKVAPAFGRGRQLLERFEGELEASAGADHIHPPQEISLVTVNGLEWLLLPSQPAPASLRSWLQSTAGDIEGRRKVGVALFRQACLGLASLHWRGKPHLALKPENILLFPEPNGGACPYRLRVADYSQGRLLRRLGRLDPIAAWSPSATPYYRSPELIQAARPKSAGAAADLYSLGAILFEILDGDPPFEGTSESLEWLHLNMEPPEPVGNAPEYLKALAARCLEKRPAQRPAGVAELGLLLSRDPEEDLAFQEAAGEGSPDAWRAFLARFPEGLRTAEAKACLVESEEREAQPKSESPTPVPQEAVAVSEGGNEAAQEMEADSSLSPETVGRHRYHNPKDGLDYLWVPPGEFGMGSSMGDSKASSNEKPRHKVRVSQGFWLCTTPVTVGAYRKYCESTGRRMPPAPPTDPRWESADNPITSVTWEEATAYAAWLWGRLPTEAEWEMAARAGTTEKHWWGEETDPDCVWFVENSGGKCPPAGKKRPNPWGFHDMLGLVWEWCDDWYGQEYYKDSPDTDPKGPSTGVFRTLRGGSYKNFPWNIRISIRNRNLPTYRGDNNGFRPILTRPAPE